MHCFVHQEEPVMSAELASENERRQDLFRGLCKEVQSERDSALERVAELEAKNAQLQVGSRMLGTLPPTASIHLNHCTSSC